MENNTYSGHSEFPIGSIVYYTKTKMWAKGRYQVCVGMVEDNTFSDVIWVNPLELVDTRTVNGIPFKEFIKTLPTQMKKLPKGWSWDTKLFNLSNYELPYTAETIKINHIDDVLKAYEMGIVVKSEDNNHGHIESIIDHGAYQIVYKAESPYDYHPATLSIRSDELYHTYEDAKKFCDDYDDECKRVAELSDYDYSVECIDKTLSRWKFIYSIPDIIIEKYRDFLLSLDNVEDIEIRILCGNIQWKRIKNRKWVNINL